MKKISLNLILLISTFALFASCTPQEDEPISQALTPSIKVEVVSTSTGSASLAVTTNLTEELVYVVTDLVDAKVPESIELYNTGVKKTVSSDSPITTLNLDELNFNTNYRLFIVAKYSMDDPATSEVENPNKVEYSEVMEVNFTTAAISSLIEILPSTDTDKITFKVNVAEGDTIGVRILQFDEYERWKNLSFVDALILSGELTNGNRSFYTESQVVEFTGWNDYYDGYTAVRPNELLYIVAGEVSVIYNDYSGLEELYAHYDLDAYNSASSSETDVEEADYWTSDYHFTANTTVAPPAESSASVSIEQINQTIYSATFNITPDKEISSFNYIYVTEGEWDLLNEWYGEDGALYWCERYSKKSSEPVELIASPLEQERNYKLVVQGWEDEEGKIQSTSIVNFTAGTASEEAPVMVVTPVETTGPYAPWEITFNIKATNSNAASITFLCNKARDWDNLLEAGVEYKTVILDYGTPITDLTIINAVNSPEGYNVTFESWEETTSRLIVIGENAEGTVSDPDVEGSTAIAETTSAKIIDAPRVESELFEELKGEWLAVARLYESYIDGNMVHHYVKSEQEVYSKVTIGDITSYSEETPAGLYAKYPDLSLEEIDQIYEEFKLEAEEFAKKTRGQNRLLGTSMDFSTIEDAATAYISPQDALLSPTYPPTNNMNDVFYDFGPKWYLQISESGQITLPINLRFITPFINMPNNRLNQYGNEIINGTYHTGVQNFDVTLSLDKNTLTVEPREFMGNTYYYTVAYPWSGFNAITPAFVCAELKFVRNGEIPEDAAKTYIPSGYAPHLKGIGEHLYPEVKKYRFTRFNKIDIPAVYKEVTMSPMTLNNR